MAEQLALARPGERRLRPPRPTPVLSPTVVVRWKCQRCGTLHLDRSERGDDAFAGRPRPAGVRGRWCWGRTHTFVETTKCCGEDWCFLVTPFPTAEVFTL